MIVPPSGGISAIGRRVPTLRNTRERVLAAAQVEFVARGLHAASIEDIAARAGLTKGAVYYYFNDKEDLAADLQAELWNRLRHEAGGHIDPAAGALENLQRAFAAFLSALDDAAEARFFLRDCWATPAARREHEHGVDVVRALLVDGIESGDLSAQLDPEATARVLLGAFAEATLHILTSGELDATLNVVTRMITSLAAPATAEPALAGVGKGRRHG